MHPFLKCTTLMLCTLSIMTQISAQEYLTRLTQNYEKINAEKLSSDSLTINEVVITALVNNPTIKDAYLNIDALAKQSLQQGLMPNPHLGLEIENILGGGPFSGVNGSEITATLSQDILLAGKLSKLQNISELETNLAYYDYEMIRLDVITNVRKSFNDVVKVQTLLVKHKELLSNTDSFIQNVKRRNEKGAVSAVEVLRANLVYNKLEIEFNSTKQKLKSLKKNLAVIMGIDKINTDYFIADNREFEAFPVLEKLIESQKSNPAISKNTLVVQRDKAKMVYEKSLAIPDLNIAAGFRRMNEFDYNTLLVSVSMTLPIYNRNQGNIAEAEIRMDQNRIRNDALIKNMAGRLTELYNYAISYRNSLAAYRETLLPQANNVLESIKLGYSQGRYKILDVLDSQNTLIDIEINYIEIQSAFLNTVYEIEKLIATSIKNVN